MAKKKQQKSASEDQDLPGNPQYTAKDDIYSNEEEVEYDENDPDSELTDLDVPGADLDDANEAVGEEDEENNYYSLGGDDHEDLEEDKE